MKLKHVRLLVQVQGIETTGNLSLLGPLQREQDEVLHFLVLKLDK